MRNIVLVGFMGAGKTTTGQLLARKLNSRFIDVDQEIEANQGKPVSEIFRLYGEDFFREQERQTIRELVPVNNAVIATGGGVMQQAENVDNLKENGWMVCLEASVETIISRIGTDRTRPLLNDANREELIDNLLQKRTPFYRLADFSVNTNKLTPEEVADRIIAFMFA